MIYLMLLTPIDDLFDVNDLPIEDLFDVNDLPIEDLFDVNDLPIDDCGAWDRAIN